jgi:hypothetical protein
MLRKGYETRLDEMNNATENGFNELIGFKAEIERIQKAITDFESGQKADIAIISEPFAGRTTLANMIEEMTAQEVTKRSLSSLVKNDDTLQIPKRSKNIVIVDNCHFLYQRTIGGFTLLEQFLKSVVSSTNLFVTTWNLYSWNYLNEVIDIGKVFPVQITLPKLGASELKKLILSRYKENEIEFADDGKTEERRIIHSVSYPVTIKRLEKTITIPFFHIHFDRIKFHLSRKEETKKAEDIIFEMIYRIANGNLGIANVVWEKSLQYPTIKPSYVRECSFKIELDYTESFILYLILSMEALTRDDVLAMSGDSKVDEILFRLAQQGLITVDKGYYKLSPEALNCIVGHLKRTGVIW